MSVTELFLTVLVLPLLVGSSQAAEPATAVAIRLQSTVKLEGDLITLGDIAEVLCSDPQLRRELEQLDLAQLNGESSLVIDRKQIELRLQLAGHDVQFLSFSGSRSTTVGTGQPDPAGSPDLATTVRDQIAQRYRLPADDLEVTLLTPWQEPTAASNVPYRYEALLPDAVPLGRRNVWIRTLQGDRLMGTRQVVVEVRRRQQVLVAARDLPIGTRIHPEDVMQEEQWSSTPYTLIALDDVLERTVSKPLRQGDLVTPPALSVVQTVKPTLVRPRESVTVVARRGALNVTLQAAEAVEGGALGDRVLLRNPDSKRLISGVVVGPGQVVIDLGGPPLPQTNSPIQTATRPGPQPR